MKKYGKLAATAHGLFILSSSVFILEFLVVAVGLEETNNAGWSKGIVLLMGILPLYEKIIVVLSNILGALAVLFTFFSRNLLLFLLSLEQIGIFILMFFFAWTLKGIFFYSIGHGILFLSSLFFMFVFYKNRKKSQTLR